MPAILGLSAFYHDSAAALMVDGQVIAAAQEERFTRKKHDPDFPANAIQYCLQESGLTEADIDYVGFLVVCGIRGSRELVGRSRGCSLAARIERGPPMAFSGSIGVRTDNSVAVAGAAAAAMARAEIGGGAGAL